MAFIPKFRGTAKCPTNSRELHPTLRCDPTSMVVLNNIAHMWLLLGRWRNEKKCTACTFHRPIRLYPTSTWKMFQEKRMQKVMFQDLNRKRNGLERWCWKMTLKDLQSADWTIYIDHGDVHWTCFQFWATNNSKNIWIIPMYSHNEIPPIPINFSMFCLVIPQ